MSASASTSTQTGHASGGGPSPSMSSISPSHAHSQTTSPTLPHSPETQRQIAEARAALEASMSNIGSSLDRDLRSRAQNLHANSAQLEKQQRDVEKATEGLRKEGEKLRKLADEGGKRVKELGNVQNWAEMLERDFLVLKETVRLANRGSEGSWETDSEGSYSDSGSEGPGGDGIAEEQTGKLDTVNSITPAPSKLQADPTKILDGEGDTKMQDDIPESVGKGKEKEVVMDSVLKEGIPIPQSEIAGESSSATTGSSVTPSSSSINTQATAVS